ncbi:pol polyprotein [Tanacetum coccineum]
MSVKDLVVCLRIEEDNKLAQKDTYASDFAKANMVEHDGSSSRSNPKGKGKDKRKNDKKSEGKYEYLAPKAGIVKKKFQGSCYNCDKPGHRATNCKMPKRVNLRQANMVNDDVDMIVMVSNVCAMIFEVNLVGTNHVGWWIDTRATRYVCADKRDVVLKMTSEKELKLTKVLYVPEIRKNLVSGWLLNKFGFCFVFESDKFVLSKNQVYVGKGYAMNDEAIDKFVLYKNEVENQLGKKIKVVRSDRGGEYVSTFAENQASAHDHDGHDYEDLTRMTNTQTPPPATTVVIPTGAPATNTVANHAEKPEKFNETVPQVKPPVEDPLYNVYCKTTTAKELWESLERKYKTEDAGTKKFVVLLHDIHAEGMTLSETFQVAAIIEKLPPSWDNKLDQKDTFAPDFAKANMVEHAGSSSRSNPKGKGKDKRKNDKKNKGKSEYLAPKAGIVKQKFQGICYNCNHPGHRAANCKMPKRVNPRRANMVNDDVDMIVMVSDVCAMISKVNLVGTNHVGWWIDTGVTRHVCTDKSMFHSFRAVDNGHKLYMGNSATADIKGEGDVVLKMTSEKELKLTKVLYVLEIRKNLMSGWLLNKFGFRLVFESDKFVLSKNQVYVGKGYAMNGMFKLNVMAVKNEINKMNSSAYLIESSNVWHAHLGHVNFNSLRRLIKFNSIPNCHIDSKYKCETCVEAKYTRTSFKSVKRTTKPLDMVHKDMLKSKFGMKDMGLADVILGIKIIRTQNGLVLSQAHYVDKILNTQNAGDFGQSRTPIDTISRLSRYTSNPSYALWKAITRVLHYLRYSRDYGLHYDRHPAVIEGYSDANWISNIKDSRSTIGYVFTLGGAAISWKSSKQTIIAKSTIESEFIALDKCEEEAEWLRQFVEDIPRPFRWWKFQALAKEVLVESCECLKFGNEDFIRRGHILNAMTDPLLDVYQNYPSVRELWKAIEERFFTEDKTRRLSRHTNSLGKEHWDAVNRVFKYLKKTMDYGLEYSGDPSVLEGYTDASWITDQEDYASMSRWIFTLGGGEVSWGSKKQSCLTDSTMVAEFVALASCCKEAE